MKRLFRLFESRRTRSSVPAIAGNGFLVTTLTGLLMTLFGSVALISAVLSWRTAASRAGDAGLAKAAAERGFHAVIDRLNDPANGHLLVTKWAVSDWVPVSNADLTACQITRNPLGAVARSAILSDTQTVGGRQVRYTLIKFKPPEYPSVAPASLPAVCRASFGNLQGGTAGFTIRGEVLQGGAVLARYELQRYTTVNSFLDTTPGNPPVSGPLAFLGTGGGDSTYITVTPPSSAADVSNASHKMSRIVRDSGSTQWSWDTGDAYLRLYCLGNDDCTDGSSTLKLPFPNDSPELALNSFRSIYPSRPPFPSGILNSSWPTRDVTGTVSYPYSSGTSLRVNCRAAAIPAPAGENLQVIACKVGKVVLDGKTMTINTFGLPVVLYLMEDTPVEIKNGQIINSYFEAKRSTDPTSWNRLRIFGNPTNAYSFPIDATVTNSALDQCDNGSKQVLKISEGARIDGAFIWVPKGEIIFEDPRTGTPQNEYSMFGAMWSCKSKFGDNVRFMTNATDDQIGIGIDQALGLGQFRYVAQGVERSQ